MKRYFLSSPVALLGYVFLFYALDMVGSFLLGYESWTWPQRVLILSGLGLSTFMGAWSLSELLKRPRKVELSIGLQAKVLGALQDGIVLSDMEGHIHYTNQALEVMSGYTNRELVGKKVDVLAYAPSQLNIPERIEQVMSDVQRESHDPLKRKDGSLVYTRSSAHVLTDEATGEQYIVGIVRDTTQLRESQRIAEEEKQRFEFFVESLPHLMWTYAPSGAIDYVNRRVRNLLGGQKNGIRPPVLEAEWYQCLHPDDLEQVMAHYTEIKQAAEPYAFEARLWDASDQRYRWFRLQGAPHRDEQGQVIKWYGTGTDITSLMELQAQVQDRERLFRSLIESQSTLVMRLRLDGTYFYVNPALQRTYFPDHDWRGMVALDLIHPEDRAEVEEIGWHCRKNVGSRRDIRLRKRLPDGTWSHTEWEFMCLTDDTGEVFFQGIGRDITARVESEQALAWERQRFTFFTESLPHVMVVNDSQGQVLFLNKAGRDLFDLPDNTNLVDIDGAKWLERVHPEDRAVAVDWFEASTQGQQLMPGRLRLRDARYGSYRWFQFHQAPQVDAQGTFMYSYGTFTDITELTQTQQQLREKERFYRSLVESQTLFLTQTNLDGTLRYANPAYSRRFFAKPDSTGYQTGTLIHPDDVELAETASQTCLETPGKPADLILRQRTLSGDWIYIEWELMCFAEKDGASTIYYFQAIGKDITARHRQEQQRKALAMIVEQTNHGVMITDYQFRIQWINRALAETTQYALDQVKGRTIYEVFSGPMTDEDTVLHIQGNLKQLRSIHTQLVKYDRTGRPYWAEVSIQPVVDEAGQLASIFTLERDITRSKMQHQELERTAHELTQRNERLNEFAYMVSHNVRSPLANLQGMGELLIEEIELTPANQNMLDFFRKAIKRLQEVIEEMEQTLQDEHTDEAWREVSLLDMFHYILDQLRLDLAQSPVRWKIDFSQAPLLRIPWTYLYNILYNLVSNAIKYREPSRPLEIEIASYVIHHQVVILLQDNGRGMDLAAIGDRLFKRGERFHDDIEGTGTGLYLIHKQMERLGGRIEVDSQLHRGTAFWLFFPLSEGPKPLTGPSVR